MSKEFYYDSGKEKVGPISASELLALHHEGTITPDTWVRRDDSSTWRRFADTDLRQEKEIEQRKSVWRALWRSMTPGTIFGAICLIFFIVGILALGVVAIQHLWMPILVLIIMAMLYRTTK